MIDMIVIFEHIQYLYLFYLLTTNLSTMTLMWIAFKRMLVTYFYKIDITFYSLLKHDIYIPISILAPAYNEQETIISSVYSLLKLSFPEYQIIIINDGSKDETLARLLSHFDLYEVAITNDLTLKHQKIRALYRSEKYENLFIIDKENGGKSDALNAAINLAKYPLICCVDADTILEETAILHGLTKFIQDRRTIAIGGAIGITNGSVIKEHTLVEKRVPKSLVEGFQVLEYLRGFFAGRMGWEKYNGLILVSGAFGIFRKDIVMKIDGYRHTIGEDFDLLLRMRKYCYNNHIKHTVGFVEEILCWTQCPSDYGSLLKQRNRWQRGLLETLYYHKDMLFRRKYGVVGMVTMPYFLLIEALGPLMTFMGVISIIVLYVFGVISSDMIVVFFLLEFVWGILLNVSSLYFEILTKRSYTKSMSFIKLFLLSILEPFFYKPLIKAESFLATFNFMNSSWGEIKRKSL